MSETNKELVLRHFEEIFNQKNLAACDEVMAEDYVEHGVAAFATTAPGRVNGPQAMRGTAKWLLAQCPDIHMTVEALVAEGDTVVARVFSEGTNPGRINEFLPPTGRRFSTYQSHWFRVADNKLEEHWATRGDLSAMVQLGIIPPRPSLVARVVGERIKHVLRRR